MDETLKNIFYPIEVLGPNSVITTPVYIIGLFLIVTILCSIIFYNWDNFKDEIDRITILFLVVVLSSIWFLTLMIFYWLFLVSFYPGILFAIFRRKAIKKYIQSKIEERKQILAQKMDDALQ